jgi:hypothetical protein
MYMCRANPMRGYGLNVRSIFRGVEGKWFRAWSAWERVARPLIEKAELTDSIQQSKTEILLLNGPTT